MALVEQGTCRITALDKKGFGIGKTDNGAVEIPYTLPGELVEFEKHEYRRESNCVLKQVIEPSAARAIAPCKYFGACGGCLLQHFSEQDYINFKENLVRQTLHDNNIETIIKPIIVIPPGNRRRLNLSVVKKNNQVFLGFFRFRSNQIINIDSCIAILPGLSDLILPLKELLYQILEDRQKAIIFLTKAENGIDITIDIAKENIENETVRSLALDFAQKNSITRLLLRARKLINVICQKEIPYVLFDQIPVEIDAHGFLQASSLSDQILSDLVLKYLPNVQDNTPVVDMFCGYGTYTLPLSRHFSVDGFESDRKAIKSLGKAIINSGRKIEIHNRDLFTYPLSNKELSKYSYAVVNPPRAGAMNQINHFEGSGIKRICYISCNLDTFAQDAKVLISSGYQLAEITPVDQFYWNPHLEVVGVFHRNEA